MSSFDFSLYDADDSNSIPDIKEVKQKLPVKKSDFNFDTYEETPVDVEKEAEEEKGKSVWSDFYDTLFSSEESPFEQGLGQSLRSVGSTLSGIPGDTVKFAKGVAEKLPQGPGFLQGIESPIQKHGKKYLEQIPGSQEIKEMYDVATQGKYQPKSESEKFLQETASDITSLLSTGPKGVLKPIIAGLSGNVIKTTLEQLGVSSDKANLAKVGTILFTSLFNPKAAVDYASSLYAKATKAGAGQSGNATNFMKNIEGFEKELAKGLTTDMPTKTPVLNALEDMKKNVVNGQLPIENFTELKRNLNTQRDAKIYSPEFMGKGVRPKLKENYAKASKILDDFATEYGKTNPEFLVPYKKANTVWGGIEASKKVSKNIGRHIKKLKPKSITDLAILAGTSPATLPGVIVGGTALKGFELMHKIAMNKELRKLYGSLVTEAVRDNSAGIVKNLHLMDKELSKKD